ncbi:MAG TPA: hypothetical protein VN253_26985 [Kofleriaceae bacterium]|nr:hypothetical protein [Kofleriaceae bacterium]
MLHSRSPSPTSSARPLTSAIAGLAAAAAALPGAGCSDDCGPGGAPSAGLVAAGDMVTLSYGDLSGLLGNDCPDPAAPEGVISLSVEGRQTAGPGLITFCIPRPDLLLEGDRTLGTPTSTADVRIIDVSGAADNCTFAFDSARPPTGTAQATGVCTNGDSPAGFALSVDGAISLRRTCGATMDTVAVTLRGRVAVARRGP